MSYHLLEYVLVEDYLDRRPAFRAEHLALAQEAHARGDLVLASDRGFVCLAPFAPGEEATAHVAPGYPFVVALASRAVPA